MTVMALTVFTLKRLLRHRAQLMVLLVVPVLIATLRSTFSYSPFFLGLAWSCPAICALLVWGVVHLHRSIDDASGFTNGLQTTPLSDAGITISYALAGGAIFAMQIVMFAVILSAKF